MWWIVFQGLELQKKEILWPLHANEHHLRTHALSKRPRGTLPVRFVLPPSTKSARMTSAVDFGQFDFGQFRFQPISTSANFVMLDFWIKKERTKEEKEDKKEKKTVLGGAINIVRVCVASPAEGQRRFHRNTAYCRLSGFNRPSCGAVPTLFQ